MKKLTLITAVSSLMFGAQAMANDFYIEGSLSNNTLEEETDMGFGLQAGYKVYKQDQFTVGLEAGYNDYASLDYSEQGIDSTLDVTSMSVGTKLGYALNDQLELFSRISYENVTADMEVDAGMLGSFSASEDSQELAFALGADYAVSSAIKVGGQYKMLTIEDELDLSSLSINVGYQF